MNNVMGLMASQLQRTGGLALEVPRYNPHPRGSIVPGSASEAVLVFLRSRPLGYFAHHEIVDATQRTNKSVSWALIYLRALGLIEGSTDDPRNLRYLRYRASKQK